MTTSQDQNVIDLLIRQHVEIRELLRQLQTGQGDKNYQFQELVRLLAIHESAEEQVVHPAARNTQFGDQVVDSRLREENEAKRALAELCELGVAHPEFDEKLANFAAAVLAHASHEEAEEFSRLRAESTDAQLRRMAGAVRAAEAVAPTRPHPHAGESAKANLIAGPPLAVFDRTRDAVRNWRQSSSA